MPLRGRLGPMRPRPDPEQIAVFRCTDEHAQDRHGEAGRQRLRLPASPKKPVYQVLRKISGGAVRPRTADQGGKGLAHRCASNLSTSRVTWAHSRPASSRAESRPSWLLLSFAHPGYLPFLDPRDDVLHPRQSGLRHADAAFQRQEPTALLAGILDCRGESLRPGRHLPQLFQLGAALPRRPAKDPKNFLIGEPVRRRRPARVTRCARDPFPAGWSASGAIPRGPPW